MKQLKRGEALKFTSEYEKDVSVELDYRKTFGIKRGTEGNIVKPYFQVFDDREGFKPNLSIVDLLFNQGPQSKTYF
ncbi:MAG: hypothetical protein EOO92_06315 [Pedobacter sp.]|nr:MAG: hypothetical protein EOO92_06315 [Pedobacter sp.]